MNDNHYKNALDAAKKEMLELLPQHTAIEKRIAKLRQTIATLTALAEDLEPDDDDERVYVPGEVERAAAAAAAGFGLGLMGRNMALSDAVREVLKASGEPLTAVQVRDGLIRMGINLEKKYTNPLAVIHRALKRLEGNGEVRPGVNDSDKNTYKWLAQSPRWLKHLNERGGNAYRDAAEKLEKEKD